MYDKSQLMRGTLEGCILKIISENLTYGYEILEILRKNGFEDLNEGTIYPILLRLEKNKNIKSEFKESPFGPKRKYYEITKDGEEYLKAFEVAFKNLNNSVNNIFNGGNLK